MAHGPGFDAENALGLGIDAADQLAFVQHHQGQGGGVQQLLQFFPGGLDFPVTHLQFLVCRFQFLIGGPDFLRGGFQLLVGGLHFLVGGFQLFQGELVAGGNFFQGPFQGRHLGRAGGHVRRRGGGGQGFHQYQGETGGGAGQGQQMEAERPAPGEFRPFRQSHGMEAFPRMFPALGEELPPGEAPGFGEQGGQGQVGFPLAEAEEIADFPEKLLAHPVVIHHHPVGGQGIQNALGEAGLGAGGALGISGKGPPQAGQEGAAEALIQGIGLVDAGFAVQHLEELGTRGDGFVAAQDQQPPFHQGLVKDLQQLFLLRWLQVNKQIAAGQQVHVQERGGMAHIVAAENQVLPQLRGDPEFPPGGEKPALPQQGRQVAQGLFRIKALAGHSQG